MKTLNQKQKHGKHSQMMKRLFKTNHLFKSVLYLILCMMPFFASCQNDDWKSEIDALKTELEAQKKLITELGNSSGRTIIDVVVGEEATIIKFSDNTEVEIPNKLEQEDNNSVSFPVVLIGEDDNYTVNGESTGVDSKLYTPVLSNGKWAIGVKEYAAGTEIFAGIVETTGTPEGNGGQIIFYFVDGTSVGIDKKGANEEQPTPAAKIRIACIGNSITYGATIANRDVNSYPAKLGEMLGGDYEVKNFGVSGKTMLMAGTDQNDPMQECAYMKTGQYRDAQAYNPDIVIIKLGTNDSKPCNWNTHKDEFEGNMQTMIDAFKELDSNPKIYLCYPTRVINDGAFTISEETIHDQIIPKISNVARENSLNVINLHNVFDGKGGLDQFYNDNVHPNEAGATILAEVISRVILENVFPSEELEHFDKVKTVGCLGDDVTFGVGANYSGGEAYPDVLNNLLGDGYEVTNYHAGSRAVVKNARETPDNELGNAYYGTNGAFLRALNNKPDIVIFNLGLNDSKPFNWEHKEQFKESYQYMIDELKKVYSPKIYLCCPTEVRNTPNGTTTVSWQTLKEEIIPLIREVAEDYVLPVIDLSALFDSKQDSECLSGDKVHPNKAGYEMIAAALKDAITTNN